MNAPGHPFRTDCRRFTGYRPCLPGRERCDGCADFHPRGDRLLIVNLDSMGDVLRSTAVLHPLKRRHPDSTITWVTLPRAAPLLENNPFLDRVLTVDAALPFILDALEFEWAGNVDKGLVSGAIMGRVRAGEKAGFGVDAGGVIVPLNREADELYRLGLDDRLKFSVNGKSELQLLAEAFGLEYRRDPYVYRFRPDEEDAMAAARRRLGLDGAPVTVGFNTGCSELYPNKKLPLDFQAGLIRRLREARPDWPVILLGGLEDGERNARLAHDCGGAVIETPTAEGPRRGMIWTGLPDVVFTGDSLGMHMAIALGKRVVAWFGLTCEQEIELYERGEKILASVECRPCWKRSCDRTVVCWERVDPDRALAAIIRQGEAAGKEKGA
jgi:ADP-heptose:LPS heptosyltransferase